MPVLPEAFRDALRLFPSGVTIVTMQAGREMHGLTVSAFASVSPEPPLILVSIDHRHHAHALLELPGATFAVNILREGQTHLSDRFAYVKDEDRFREGAWRTAITGAPILADALAWLDCTVFSSHVAANHTIYIGEVQASGVFEPESLPIIYWNRAYRKLASPSE